ncbi:SEC31-like protein [Spraguea lophii 42_110]|uniref:SEC31-like protein n=1 Tax=Spraguea lophii (strain 42_110) TaxID=1358809 RepID=S7XRK1_SPRLO|nr:SEC31-like protein [Spraguea lophii 42_110]
MVISARMLSSFHPTLPLVVFATKAKLFDPTFSSESELVLYNYITEKFYPKIELEYRCNRIEWCGNYIVIGMENGKISVFECVKENNDENSYFLKEIYSNDTLLHGDIMGISYNANKNMIAIGSNSLILLSTKQLDKPYNSGIKTDLNGINYIQWNSRISHIMVVGTLRGVLILDLKQKKEILRIVIERFNEGRKIVQVEFHPLKNTCLLIATESKLFNYDLSNDNLEEIYSVENIFNFNIVGKNLLLGSKNKLVLLSMEHNKILGEVDFEGIFDCRVSMRDSLISISYLDNGTKLVSMNSIFNLRRKCGSFFVLKNEKIFTGENIFKVKYFLPEVRKGFEDEKITKIYENSLNFEEIEFTQDDIKSFYMDDNLMKAIFAKNRELTLEEAKKEKVEVNLSYFLEKEEIDNCKVNVLEAIKNNNYDEIIKKVALGDWYLVIRLILIYNKNEENKIELDEKILKSISLLGDRLKDNKKYQEAKYAYFIARNYKEYFKLRANDYRLRLFSYDKFIKESTALAGEYFLLKEISDVEENKYLKEYFKYMDMVGLNIDKKNTKTENVLDNKVERMNITEKRNIIQNKENQTIKEPKKPEYKRGLEPRKIEQRKPIKSPEIKPKPMPLQKQQLENNNERKMIPTPKKSIEKNIIEKTEEIKKEEKKPRTYGSLRNKSVERTIPKKDNLPEKKNILPQKKDNTDDITKKNILPQKKESHIEEKNEVESIEKFMDLKNKIDFICEKSKDIKKLVFKGRIKDSLKRIKYFYDNEKNIMSSENKYLDDISDILSFDIEELKKEIENKNKGFKDKIMSEMKMKLEHRDGDKYNEKIWLPGVMNLIGMIFSE